MIADILQIMEYDLSWPRTTQIWFLLSTVGRIHRHHSSVASTFPPHKTFLLCEEHARIAAWLTKNNLGLEFNGSFLDHCS
jgi:hypothetical protein